MAAKPKEAFASLQTGTPPVQKQYEGFTQRETDVNVGDPERWASSISGGALAAYGLKKGGLGGLSLALLGGGLVYRGITGHCHLYEAVHLNTATEKGSRASVKHGEGIKVTRNVTIGKPAAELYRFWRNFENLPQIMSHLQSVQVLDEKLSHWIAKAPAGMTAEWDAQIINEKANELIAWRSLEGATIPNAGSVQFKQAPGGRGTVVQVEINYDAPGGPVGAAIAKLFGEEPSQQIEEDLRRFKRVMEAGEAPSTEGQSSGREAKGEKDEAKASVPGSSEHQGRGGQKHEGPDPQIPGDRNLVTGS